MGRFLKDSTLNIISNLIVVVVIQLMAFPVINKNVNNDQFALLIVLYGIAIVVATSLGNTLNNVRLLH
ncbi:capsular biosynthesis protein, partial [Staphylococcus petrasii]